MKLNALLLTVSLGLAATPGAWALPPLYDNLDNTPFISPAMYNTATWGASKFNTGANAYILNTVVLLLAQSGSCTAQLDIYSDSSGLPGTSVGTLTSPEIIPLDTPAPLTFTASGISLSANSSYWVVLRAPTGQEGQLWWSYTENTFGIGPGFSPIYTASDNAGSNWDAVDSTYPNQLRINATLAAVPEPSQWAMMGVTALGVTGYALRRRLAKTN